ncbi:AprI/Inh family metalloprotease inhibitor [Stenotrophomonas sp.]|uniref:AprI/Inh family metalloprotease inhibitor n=1 Tax=Stenotrophomonas sp. TaxID=69392 RepID=UPI002FC909C5
MAIAPSRLLCLCCLTLPVAIAHAQDASFGIDEQTTRSEQTSSTTTTSTTQSMGDPQQQGNSSTDQNGDKAFGNLGAINQQTDTSGSRHTETRTERKGASVDLDLGGDDDWGHDHDHGDRFGDRNDSDADIAGHWTLGMESGNTCTIELKDSEWFGGHGAYVPAGCPDGFFSANRWVMSGRQLLITDTNNTVIGRFKPAGGGRWSGRRESDGARLYLNPAGR